MLIKLEVPPYIIYLGAEGIKIWEEAWRKEAERLGLKLIDEEEIIKKEES